MTQIPILKKVIVL